MSLVPAPTKPPRLDPLVADRGLSRTEADARPDALRQRATTRLPREVIGLSPDSA
jgi:hypothetical protein